MTTTDRGQRILRSPRIAIVCMWLRTMPIVDTILRRFVDLLII